jgi:hypothetical protein
VSDAKYFILGCVLFIVAMCVIGWGMPHCVRWDAYTCDVMECAYSDGRVCREYRHKTVCTRCGAESGWWER